MLILSLGREYLRVRKKAIKRHTTILSKIV